MSASDKTLASASPASGNLALLAAIVVFAAITPTILMTAPAVAAQLATQWQLSPARVGDLFSVELGAMSLATLPAFHWLKRVDWRHAALLAGLLFIAANLASALAGSYPLLLALRFCSALAGGSLMILCLSSAASTATPSRVYGLWVMGQLVVGAVGLALLPALFERFGLAACYLVLAGLMGLALPLSRAFPSGSPPAEARASTGAVHSRLRVGLGILAVLTFYISLSGVWTFIGAIAEGAVTQTVSGAHLGAERDRLGRARPDAAARRDQLRVVVGLLPLIAFFGPGGDLGLGEAMQVTGLKLGHRGDGGIQALGPGGLQGINEVVGRLGFNPDHADPGFGD